MTVTPTPAPPAHAASPGPLAIVANWVAGVSVLHLLGLIAIVVLLALGTISVAVGLPILTGLVGLAIPTSTS
jgi:hypothetical protein